jgi:preprotein translocase SecE subunit
VATAGIERETHYVEPLLDGARTPPRPPDPPAPPITGWAGWAPRRPEGPVPVRTFRRRGLFREVFAELKQVAWPSPLSTARNTRVVLGVLAIFVTGIAALDIASGHTVASFIR